MENTFSRDLTNLDEMRAELGLLVDKVWRYCESSPKTRCPTSVSTLCST